MMSKIACYVLGLWCVAVAPTATAAPDEAAAVERHEDQQITDAALAAEAKLLATVGELAVNEAADHWLDVSDYSVQFRRFGDFLLVTVARRGEKAAAALDIGRTQEIHLAAGHAADRDGEASYFVYEQSNDDDRYIFAGVLDATKPARPGRHYEVSPTAPARRGAHDYPMLQMALAPGRSGIASACPTGSVTSEFLSGTTSCAWTTTTSYTGYPRAALVTKNYPRPAEDDRIEFVGIGATLFVPAQRGAAVLDEIMAEVARGWEPPTSVIRGKRGQ